MFVGVGRLHVRMGAPLAPLAGFWSTVRDMSREEILNELEGALKHFFSEGIADPVKKEAMREAVERFVRDEAAALSEEELLERFDSQENAFKLMFEYLLGKGTVQIV